MANGQGSTGSRLNETHAADADRTDSRGRIRALIQDVLSADYPARLQSAVLLGLQGEEAADELIRVLQRSNDESPFPVVTQVLEAMGKNVHGAVLRALHGIELKRPNDVYLAECLLDVIAAHGNGKMSEAAAAVIDRCAAASRDARDEELVPLYQHARVKAHALLADLSDRSRLNDLIRLSESEGPHLLPEVIDALHEIGDRRAIRPLLRSYQVQESFALQDDIKDACQQVMKRENLTPDDPFFEKLPSEEKNAFQKIFPRARNGNGNGHGNGGGPDGGK